MTRAPYPTDLTDRRWARLAPHLPPPKPGGRPRSTDLREVVNAILDVLRNGIVWRAVPHDFPPWETVYSSFSTWRRAGVWEGAHDVLREQVRATDGRAAILDRQSVTTTEKGGPGATTRPSTSTAGNGTSWSIRWACC